MDFRARNGYNSIAPRLSDIFNPTMPFISAFSDVANRLTTIVCHPSDYFAVWSIFMDSDFVSCESCRSIFLNPLEICCVWVFCSWLASSNLV